MNTKISIVNVNNYQNIQEAVVSAIKAIENHLSFKFLDYNSILLKPNLLISEKNACTQPNIVEGVVCYLKEKGIKVNNICIGDSPGQFKQSALSIAKSIGLYEVCEKHGLKFVDFESLTPIKEKIKNGLILKEIFVSKIVKDIDIIINLPRLKTHAEATITGAIKNYWGILPGGQKVKYHLLGKNAEQFGEILIDNFSWIIQNKPNRLTVYDLHTIMEGSLGPVSGNMKKWNLILVGTDELALDLVACEIGKFKGIYVPHLKSAVKRNLGNFNLKEIEFLGMQLEEAKKITPKFNVPNDFLTKIASYLTGNIGYKLLEKIPKLNKDLCKKCGQCSQICPAEAIIFQDKNYPYFERKKCISCLCCMELCPEHAIVSERKGLSGLLDFI